MNKRGIFGALALILALIGGALLFFYVSGADQRALATLEPKPVLVVKQEIPAGMRTADLAEYVEVRELPTNAIVPGALAEVGELPAGQVAVTALKQGEQVLAARFVSPDDNQIAASVPIPEGLQLISIQLSPERVAGAQLNAGDKVGVLVSIEAEVDPTTAPSPAATDDADEEAAPAGADVEAETRAQTSLIANDVLVARVQGAPAQQTPDSTTGEQLPGNEVIVTLAVDAPLGSKLVFAKEYGSIWLSRQTPTTDSTGAQIVDSGTVLK